MTQISDRLSAPDHRRVRHRWPDWADYAATLWAFGYSLVALVWTLTRTPPPIKNNDDGDALSLLAALPDGYAAPLFAAVAVTATVIGLAMARARHPVPDWLRRSGLVFGTTLAAVLLLVVPDMRLLALVGYLPMIIVVGPFDAEFRTEVAEALTVVYVHQLVAVVGGLLWAAATLAFARRTLGSCPQCGRGGRQRLWTTPEAAARWGRIAVAFAVAVPVIYAATRWIWVLGVPLGVDREFHTEAMADGSLWSGAWLGSFALVGAVLTLGLVQRWGEVFPRWMPLVRGRRVPIGLAVYPACLVAVLLTGGGISLVTTSVADGTFTWNEWAAAGPAFLMPVWGVALAAGTLAYYLRRRGPCGRC